MIELLQKVIDLHQQGKLSDLQATLAGGLVETGMSYEVEEMLQSWLETQE